MELKFIAGDMAENKYDFYLRALDVSYANYKKGKITQLQLEDNIAQIYVHFKDNLDYFNTVILMRILDYSNKLSEFLKKSITILYQAVSDERFNLTFCLGGSVGRGECPPVSDIDFLLIGSNRQLIDMVYLKFTESVGRMFEIVNSLNSKHSFLIDDFFGRLILTGDISKKDAVDLFVYQAVDAATNYGGYISMKNMDDKIASFFKRAFIDFYPTENQKNERFNEIAKSFNELANLDDDFIQSDMKDAIKDYFRMGDIVTIEKVSIKEFVRLYQYMVYYIKMFLLKNPKVYNASLEQLESILRDQNIFEEKDIENFIENYKFLLAVLNISLKEGLFFSISDEENQNIYQKYLNVGTQKVVDRVAACFSFSKYIFEKYFQTDL